MRRFFGRCRLLWTRHGTGRISSGCASRLFNSTLSIPLRSRRSAGCKVHTVARQGWRSCKTSLFGLLGAGTDRMHGTWPMGHHGVIILCIAALLTTASRATQLFDVRC
ncbi:hypothetical protein K402DRAFT_67238 [Aulographum hederae CBS 113979]|uniref:Uncharacterized protein n=1 Tax=Aulographum hederae CBS 113979 TaxID=1176131 RepID=A0A6G1H1G7_9PEZI|nr:hypothetical protein K402DRAFT_67238 [Aulographum hederae CBS 113979]